MFKLTHLEKEVLKKLIISADGNGNDFGFIEDARGVCGKAQLSGVVASLVKKQIIVVHEPVRPCDQPGVEWTQFTWGPVVELNQRMLKISVEETPKGATRPKPFSPSTRTTAKSLEVKNAWKQNGRMHLRVRDKKTGTYLFFVEGV